MSRSSSSSSSSFAESNGGMEGISLVPLTSHDGDHRPPERSLLRQRTTTSAAPSLISPRDEDESLSNSEDDEPKGGNNPSVLRSVLGASPFLMGPHIFSTSELCPPQRARKESCDKTDLQKNIDKSSIPPSSSNSTLYRRAALQSPLMVSPPSSTHGGSSFSDVDLENGEQNCDEAAHLVSTTPTIKRRQPLNSYQKGYAFVLRSRENVIIHFLMEAKMLQTDLLFLLFATFWQFFHSAVTNVAYWQHAQLNAANRVPLRDVAFDMLPQLDGELWIVSEYILWAILGVSITCIVSNLIVRWNAPHGRPIYCMQIVRRMGMTWVVCQTLRMISFLVTTLPGASRQCRYAVPDGLTSAEMLNGPAPNEGNPAGWAPPTETNDILFRVDATNGCGDLMFSSHTIYTMTFVCVVFKYFNFRWLKLIMALGQIAIVPFILAARKHYSVDVFTALYVTPLVFEILWTRFPDRDTSVDLAKYYGIQFYLAQEGRDAFSYVVSIWGREFFVDPDQLPVDISPGAYHGKGLSLPWGKGGETTRSTASIV
ncbi:hypothetical protein ACHAXR_009514 [Thalassiosira sp. AJA248-18]